MKFKIQNRRDTFLTVKLGSKDVTVPSRGEIGPVTDAVMEMSPGLKRMESAGDILIIPIEESPKPTIAPEAETKKAKIKAEDK